MTLTEEQKKRLEEILNKFLNGNPYVNNGDWDEAYDSIGYIISQAVQKERERAVEVLARYLYGQMEYDGEGKKPNWVVNGNSLKQDEARAMARKALTSPEGNL